MAQFAAAGSWRQPHILRPSLGALRDLTTTVAVALDELLETLERRLAPVDRCTSARWAELQRMCV
jgi:hypothetical protein